MICVPFDKSLLEELCTEGVALPAKQVVEGLPSGSKLVAVSMQGETVYFFFQQPGEETQAKAAVYAPLQPRVHVGEQPLQ